MSGSSAATIIYTPPPSPVRIPPPLQFRWGPIRLFREAHVEDDLLCAEWCLQLGLIKPSTCRSHRIPRTLVKRDDRHPEWYCPRCRERKSAVEGTIFEDTNLSIGQILLLAYCWSHGLTYEETRSVLIMERHQEGPSDRTIAKWFSVFRDRIIDAAEELETRGSHSRIGGPGTVVQIDEALIGRRKYNRGRVIEGTWVVGMVAEDGQLRLRKCPSNRRNAETLNAIILRDVAPGTTIHTDGWRGYDGLAQLGYIHHRVNHRHEFVAVDGTHTQRIESQWRALRRRFSPGGRRHEDLEDNLVEYLWLRDCKRRDIDTFASFIMLLAN